MLCNTLRLLLVLPLLTACAQDQVAPNPASVPSLAISDARHNHGNDHFFFLPPVVQQPHATGVFDGSLEPVVEICEWAGNCGAVIGLFIRRPKGDQHRGPRDEDDDDDDADGNFLVKKAGQHYSIDWDTKRCVNGRCALDPVKTYRIRIRVAGVELGYADVDLVANKADLRNVETNDFIGLVNGKTLKVKFRIELGAIHVVPATGGGTPVTPAAGGTVATADGSVSLEIPPGALPASGTPTTIAIAPILPAVPDAKLIPSATYRFGPDGAQFSQPVQVTVGYDPGQVPPNVATSRLRLFTLVDGVWVLVQGSRVDQVLHQVTGAVLHFSDYGVGALPLLSDLWIANSCGSAPFGFDYDTEVYCRQNPETEPKSWIVPQGNGLGLAIWMADSTYAITPILTVGNLIVGYDFAVTSSDPAIASVDSVWTQADMSNPTRCWPITQIECGATGGVVWISGRGVGEAVLTAASEGLVSTQRVTVVAPL